MTHRFEKPDFPSAAFKDASIPDLKNPYDRPILAQHGLTTAEILYHMPDHPSFLQSFVWQQLDIAPSFPILKRFLDFWESSLDGKLHSVTVAHKDIATPATYRYADGLLHLH